MPIPQRLFALFLALLALSLSAERQDKSPTIMAVNREMGVSFSPSVIGYGEYVPAWLNSEHGWVIGGGFKASAPFEALRTRWLAEATYEYNDGTTKHTMPNIAPTVAAFITNDMFVGVGPTFTPTSRLSATPEAYAEYREWHRGLPFNVLDLIEHYTFWAPGIGVRGAYNPSGGLVLTARGGFAYTVSPMMSGSGDLTTQVPPHTFSLDQHDVWRAGLGADYAVRRRIHAFGGINYSHFGFGKSTGASAGPIIGGQHHEPNSVTDLGKVNVGIAWSY